MHTLSFSPHKLKSLMVRLRSLCGPFIQWCVRSAVRAARARYVVPLVIMGIFQLLGGALRAAPVFSGVAAGHQHSLFLMNDGSVRATGLNSSGQLGLGNTSDRGAPVLIPSLTGITANSAGYGHSLFLKNDGSVWATGLNSSGQLGLGNTLDRSTPIQIVSLSGITALSAGDWHSLFLKTDGTVLATGNNDKGGLGTGNAIARSTPVQIASLSGITAISSGWFYSLFLKNDGTVWVTGSNDHGQLGLGDTIDRNTPVQIPGLNDITAITSGGSRSFFLKNDGSVWVTGVNGTTPTQISALSGISAISANVNISLFLKSDGRVWAMESNSPVQMASLSGITAISAGNYHSLFLKNDGSVWARGSNAQGQLGTGTITNIIQTTPVQTLLPPLIQTQPANATILAGNTYALSVVASTAGTPTYQWYRGTSGTTTQPISGANSSSYTTPALTLTTSYWVQVTNPAGFVNSQTAKVTVLPQVTTPTPVYYLGSGGTVALAVTTQGTGLIYQWYLGASGATGSPVSGATGASYTTPALTGTASYWVRVSNADGFTDSSTITAQVILAPVISQHPASATINAGSSATLSVSASGTALSYQWYAGVSGVTANPVSGAASSTYTPDPLSATTSFWVRVTNAAGSVNSAAATVTVLHPPVITSTPLVFYRYGTTAPVLTLAATGTGLSYQWYAGLSGDSSAPVAGATLASFTPPPTSAFARYWARVSNVDGNKLSATYTVYTPQTALSSGYEHSLFLKNDGSVWATGSNTYGQLGTGDATNRSTPVQIASLSGMSAISAGYEHSLFLKNDGSVWGAGRTSNGQLGTGDTTNRSTPVQIASLSGITAISAGLYHTLFLKNDGSVWATGRNSNGQFGTGDTTSRFTPVQIASLSGISAISAGYEHSLFLKSDGSVWATGSNNYGQLGTGDTTGRFTTVQIASLSGISAISAGYEHSLFLKNDGSVWGTGRNSNGQLGTGDTTNRITPVQIASLSGITAISSAIHSMFLRNDGSVWATGSNNYGQLGTGGGANLSTPVHIATLSGITAVTAGGGHSMWLKNNGSVWVTGWNAAGQLGTDNTTSLNLPINPYALESSVSQTITFPAIGNRVMTSPTVLLTGAAAATTTSGLTITYAVVSGPATLSGTTLTLTGEGTVTISASQAGNMAFNPASVSQTFTVSRAPQTITFPAIGDRLRTSPTVFLTGAAAATTTSGLPITYAVVTGPATLSGTTLSLTAEGSVTVSASQAGTTAYSPASVSQTFTVSRAPQTITFPAIGNRVMTSPTVLLTGAAAATTTSGLTITYAVVSGPATLSGTTLTLTGEGSVTVSASHAGNTVYAAASVSQMFSVSRVSQTITFPTIANRPFGVGLISMQASSSSGLPVSYSIVSGQATVNGSQLQMTGAGTITVRASQLGDAAYAPAASKEVTFTVAPNTAGPSFIAISKSWFYDNAALNTVVGTLSAADPDAGDVITYTKVSGTGATDNAKFSVTGGVLRTAFTAFNYETGPTASVRVRATDSAGRFTEQVIILNIMSATPNARFIPAGLPFTQSPNYVNAVFMLVNKSTGRGIMYPRSFFDPASADYQPDLFQAFEGTTLSSPASPIAHNESYFQVGKITDVPSKVRTVILLDCSSSISIADLALIKTAAKGMVDNMFSEQEIAVYSFSGTWTKLQDFLGKSDANQTTLKAAIDTLTRGSATTNLYGSMLEMLSLPKWKESFTEAGIETGFLVVLTDGADTSGAATKEQVIAKRNDVVNEGREMRRIYTIGLGLAIEEPVLRELQNTSFYKPVSQAADLAAAFAEIQQDILDLANSFYRFNYVSPKRASNPLGTFRKLEVQLKNNTNPATDRLLSTKFISDTFKDLAPAMYINRTVRDLLGIGSLAISRDLPATAYGITLFPPLDSSSFIWTIGNPALATLTPQGAIGERVIISPNGQNGTTTLTLTDTISNFTKTIPLFIGTGAALTPQSITFTGPSNRTTTAPAFNLSASASSSLPVSFTLVSGPATLSSNTVTLTGIAGTVLIRASQAGNATYAEATPVERSVIVSQATQTLTFGTLPNKPFGAAAFPLSATASSGLAPAFSIVEGPATLSGNTLTMTGPGLVTVQASQAGNDTYAAATPVVRSFTVTPVSGAEKPTFSDEDLLEAFATVQVAQTVNFVIPSSNYPTKFIVTGLPLGIKLDAATGRLTGQATAPKLAKGVVISYQVKVSASNATGFSDVKTVPWLVTPLGAAEVGNFYGLIGRDHPLSEELGGTLKVTVAATGTVTGMVKLASKSYAFKGSLTKDNADAFFVVHADVIRKGGLAPLYLDFTIGAEAYDSEEFEETVAVLGSDEGGEGSVTVFHSPWGAKAPATKYVGSYNTAFDPQGGDGPAGLGFVVVKIAAGGLVSWSGKLADATALTGSAPLGKGGQVALHNMLYANTGCAQGTSIITIAGGGEEAFAEPLTKLVDGGIYWLKNQQPEKSTTRSYKLGFVLDEVKVIGGSYVKPATDQPVLGFSTAALPAANALLTFSESSAGIGDLESWNVSINGKNAVTVETPNDFGVKLKLAAKTGTFSGAFILKNDDPTDAVEPIAKVTRNVIYTGILITREDFNRGVGFFNVAELPFMNLNVTPAKKITTTPLWSGSVSLDSQ